MDLNETPIDDDAGSDDEIIRRLRRTPVDQRRSEFERLIEQRVNQQPIEEADA